MKRRDMWRDGMMGLIVGDALGVPVQFKSRKEIKNRQEGPVTEMEAGGVYRMPEGTWSDDSSMALATLASIIEMKTCDPGDIMMRFVDWLENGAYTPFGRAFDQGITCTRAIYNYERHHDYTTCGVTGEHANGNGALMRILPACLFYAEQEKEGLITEDEAVAGIYTIAALTHSHLRSCICCGMYYFMVKSLLDGKDKDLQAMLQTGIVQGLKYYRKDAHNNRQLSYLRRIFELDVLKALPEEKIRSTGYVIDTIEAALWCLVTTDTYRDCMIKAVNLGDDTDTVAAIAGGLAGLYYGCENIPESWLKVIKKREWIEGMML